MSAVNAHEHSFISTQTKTTIPQTSLLRIFPVYTIPDNFLVTDIKMRKYILNDDVTNDLRNGYKSFLI